MPVEAPLTKTVFFSRATKASLLEGETRRPNPEGSSWATRRCRACSMLALRVVTNDGDERTR